MRGAASARRDELYPRGLLGALREWGVIGGRQWRLLALSAGMVLSACGAARSQEIELGVLPNVSARVILTSYEPFVAYLGARLGRQVRVSTAPRFVDFHKRTIAGEYDIVVTSANLGRLAEVDAGLEAIAVYEPPIPGLLVRHVANPATSYDALRGKALAMANPESLVAMRGIKWLQERGLTIDVDYRVIHARNEDSLAQLLAQGDAPLAMMSLGEFKAIRPDISRSLEILLEFTRVPGFFVLVGRRFDPAMTASIRAAILEFPRAEEGQRFRERAGISDIRPIRNEDRRAVEPLLGETRLLMSRP